MTNRMRVRIKLGTLLVTLGLLLVASSALAQGGATAPGGDGTSTATQTAPSGTEASTTPADTGNTNTGTTTSGGASSSGDADKQNDDDDVSLVVLVLLFGLLVIVAMLIYLYAIQSRHYETVDAIVSVGGDIPPAVSVGTFALDRGDVPVTIDGPGIVTVGKPAAFTARQGSTEVIVDWSVEPARENAPAGASVDPANGATTKLTATTAGSYKLTAKLQGQMADQVTVMAVAPAGGGSGGAGLAFIGEGYGTLVLAIVVLAAATVLGILDILDGAALATLFGTIVGYIFVKGAVATSGGGGQAGGAQGGGGQGGGPAQD